MHNEALACMGYELKRKKKKKRRAVFFPKTQNFC